MNPQDTLDRLDLLIQSISILRHPFYVAWQRGELTADQLATYAQGDYPHVASFPRYREAAIDSADDPVIRAELERNLADERMVPKAHNELWLDFAEGLGLDRDSVATNDWHTAAEALVHAFGRLTGDGSAGALAALYAYESQQPEVSQEKMAGLRRDYGVENPKGLAYFEVHAEADIQDRKSTRLN